MDDVTRILNEIERGEAGASAKLLPLVYDELRRLAARHLRQESAGQTLQPTALVHEAYLRLVGSDPEKPWDGRGHFFAAAAEAMRRILIDNARKKKRPKHGGDREKVELDDVAVVVSASDDDLISLDDALKAFEETDPETAQLVKLHYFAGLSYQQIGKALNMSERTANRRWDYAKAWLRRRMRSQVDGSAQGRA